MAGGIRCNCDPACICRTGVGADTTGEPWPIPRGLDAAWRAFLSETQDAGIGKHAGCPKGHVTVPGRPTCYISKSIDEMTFPDEREIPDESWHADIIGGFSGDSTADTALDRLEPVRDGYNSRLCPDAWRTPLEGDGRPARDGRKAKQWGRAWPVDDTPFQPYCVDLYRVNSDNEVLDVTHYHRLYECDTP